jgi:CcmD family protein
MATLAELPALPLHTAGKYVAAAYVVLFALVLVYVAIMAMRMRRIERELGELLAETDEAGATHTHEAPDGASTPAGASGSPAGVATAAGEGPRPGSAGA